MVRPAHRTTAGRRRAGRLPPRSHPAWLQVAAGSRRATDVGAGARSLELLGSTANGVGYLLKDRLVQVGDFLDALAALGEGRAAFDPEVVRQLLARPSRTDPLARLTPREREVLAAMAQGHTNARIAGDLFVPQSAVEKHVNAIFDKLGLSHVTGYSRRVLAVLRHLGDP